MNGLLSANQGKHNKAIGVIDPIFVLCFFQFGPVLVLDANALEHEKCQGLKTRRA